MQPVPEDKEMEDVTPSEPKGKQKEVPAVVPTPSHSPEVAPNKPKTDRVVPLRKEPWFEVTEPKATNEKPKYQPLQYRYLTELMNKTDPEKVFQNLLSQPVMLKLGEVLGLSFELAQQFQTATKSQHFAVLQMGVAEVDEERDAMESGDPVEFLVNSGEARSSNAFTEELYEMTYQTMLQWEYKEQFTHFVPEVNLVQPHEYRAMVTACLNRKIGEHDYMMLVDSGSELNIMTLQQAQELALPIDDSGNSWTLKGISGHTMGLEGICWNIPVRIGGIEFSHNFFVTRTDLGNKDMVLGQPWLFSQSMRIDYVHNMGVMLQLWEDGDRKGRSVLTNLPLVKAPRNVMPANLC